jgi:hypothetical protein
LIAATVPETGGAELLDGARRLQLAADLAALDSLADLGQLDGDDLAGPQLTDLGNSELGDVVLHPYPEMVIGEAKHGAGRAVVDFHSLLARRHGALITSPHFDVKSGFSVGRRPAGAAISAADLRVGERSPTPRASGVGLR